MISRPAATALFLGLCPFLFAQSDPVGAGHWEGAIKIPNRAMKVIVDLARNGHGEWTGDIDVPDQGIRNFPLSKIKVEGNAVQFQLAGIPGEPSFDGEISPDGTLMAGDFGGGGGSVGAEFKWSGAPKVVEPVQSNAVGKEFEGVWAGVLTDPDGQRQRLRFTFANDAAGHCTGRFQSENGGPELPLGAIVQNGRRLRFEAGIAGAVYEGELEGEYLYGTWTQGNAAMPLALSRPVQK
jgi:hypothetical protein